MKKWIIIGAVLVLVGGLTGAGYLLVSRLGGPGAGEDAGLQEAAMDVGGAPVEVVLGEVSSVLVLDAVVRAEPGEPVEARNGGTVSHLWVGEGAELGQGAPVVNVKVPAQGEPVVGEDGRVPDALTTEEVTLYAPAAGTVSGLEDVMVGDVLEPGAVVATVAPEEFRAVASIPPNDLYRFYEDPRDILLQIDQGPPATACEFLSLGTAEGGAPVPDDGGGEGAEDVGGGGGGAELACRVPADLEVFEGVQGQLSVSTGTAANALVIPVTAVRGTAGAGEVVVVGEDGTEETREVVLGVSDGSSVEVTEGLSIGEAVLDPIPLDPRFDVPGAHDPEDGFAEEGEG
ncbi:HlyD family efflux transporter periplasmic adaptor subunit [Nocardiopsis sp. HUAS JQ3]|uniref:HlyD family efflux transporter periplasmic adaptor subunit n=1 Tax=Nocardiopsis sp. HUAS JQ3 TaxID=3061629 RepID=UPI0023A94087|nr:HlyD family efflux transporter periplasmic adaptor subunit [Nocardiopsis sp. HUAS JQ3]WDZ89881.1 HlyD family efflux transporter periplasmic adaptor subunit [Nocardiopsis sp. HUAS JQ3]